MKEKLFYTIKILSRISIAILIFVLTGLLLSYSQGYRFDLTKIQFNTTGALSISTSQFRSDIYLNGEKEGKSPKSFTSLVPGSYRLRVTRNDYYDWERDIDIFAEKNTPVNVTQFLKNPKLSTIFKLDSYLIDLKTDQNNNYIYFATSSNPNSFQESFKTDVPVTLQETVEVIPNVDITLKPLKIWKFNINQNFWDLRENPTLVYETQVQDLDNAKIFPSPDGNKLYFTYSQIINSETKAITISNIDITTETLTKSEILSGNTFNNTVESLDLTPIYNKNPLKTYSVTWAKDNKHLIISSDSEIYSYNIDTGLNKEIFRNQSQRYDNWDTDIEGNIYVSSSQNLDKNGTLPHEVAQIPLEQNGFEVILSDINSNIEKIYSYPELNMIIIENDKSIVLYSLDKEISRTISKTPSQFISISPNEYKILYKDFSNDSLNIFTFDKDQGDPTTEIGTKKSIKTSKLLDPKYTYWGASSDYLTYIDNGIFNTIDIFGYNKQELLDLENTFAIVNRNSDKAYTFINEGNFLSLVQISIR